MSAMPETECTWTEMHEGDWTTSCGRGAYDNPVALKLSFCSYCGKRIDARPYPEGGEYLRKIVDPAPANSEALIRQKCSDLAGFLVQKNKAYGDSAISPRPIFAQGASAGLSICARIDDKLNRIASGIPGAYGDNDLLDLTGYLILLMIVRDRGETPEVKRER